MSFKKSDLENFIEKNLKHAWLDGYYKKEIAKKNYEIISKFNKFDADKKEKVEKVVSILKSNNK